MQITPGTYQTYGGGRAVVVWSGQQAVGHIGTQGYVWYFDGTVAWPPTAPVESVIVSEYTNERPQDCPICGKEARCEQYGGNRFYCGCMDKDGECLCGPAKKSVSEAIAAWNRLHADEEEAAQ